jgi:hypothetical protein
MLTSGKNLGGQFTAREGEAFALSQGHGVARAGLRPFDRGVSARRPVHLALTQYVHMDVVNGLSTFFIAVHHYPETFLAAQFQGQALGGKQNMASQGFVVFAQVIQGADGFLRDYQEMYRRLWGDIVEGEDLVIFVDDLRGYFSVDDFGEQSIHSCFSI